MIEIRKVGLIDIDVDSLKDVKRTKWVMVIIKDDSLKIQLIDNKRRGAHRIRYYNSGAQIEAEEVIQDNKLGGIFKTRTVGNTISINLTKGIQHDY